MDEIFDFLSDMFKPMPIQELAAIHLKVPCITSEGRTIRIAPGDLVYIEKKELKDMKEYPTHRIVKCMGRPSTDFSIHVADIVDGKESIVYL